ncbi:DNA-formamidopyrimidine glycosylase [Hymenobacter busanensis]|uniref:Formamidopyrimidine-DNA glycosylase n=1 Tax=Hymenobacter busanensis TaxID=2607656 RepID=A0A7L4ZT37_9BACT|nr:DNA-formamidopyrimidine glycosylase [Hymenobacter busanensis]KAA9327555.1 DNA-formamidopyrimidine glycosylase [Hymenobacter busanensis]QHJ06107.1 DNA-formamidopyrimidine glycosylase [Hymenobacter busanensis]
MPELPEVETYRRFLDELVLGQTIAAVEILDAKVLAVEADTLRREVSGAAVTATRRLGKNCFLELSTGKVLVLHFGMTGDVGAYRDDYDRPRFTRVALHLDSGLRIAFIDPRKFGRIRLTDSVAAFQLAKKLGPDALELTAAELQTALARKKTLLKPLLLDQRLTAGLGNWIVDEVLFQAAVHPERRANTLEPAEVERVHAAVQLVLHTAIEQEATYRQFPASFLIHAREWDESPDPHSDAHEYCPRDRAPIVKKYVGGRATYYCPTCQPTPSEE